MPIFRQTGFRGGDVELSPDTALDDDELAGAREAVAHGDWLAARDLLARTGRDWDRKAHRVAVLAETAARQLGWADTWAGAEDDNPDALLVRGHAEILRGWQAHRQGDGGGSAAGGGGGPGRGADDDYWRFVRSVRDAEQLCRRAAELGPDDPTPWVSLLLIARTQGESEEEFWRRWAELRARDPYSREGHHQALQYLFARWCGSHGQMFDFVYRAVDEAPPGSPLAVLPLYAHAEFYAYVTGGDDAARAEHAEHWLRPQIQADIEHALDRWLGARPAAGARDVVDHNYLAHALVCSRRWREAAPLFLAIGPYATEYPWAYTGADAAEEFRQARRKALRKG
jgi:hypothetical protein